jgi:urease gamma subunit
MSRTTDWVIAEQERVGGKYTLEQIEGWMNDSYKLFIAEQALQVIAEGFPVSDCHAVCVVAAQALEKIREGRSAPVVDPETISGHDYATELEHRRHVLETTREQSE